MKKVLETGIKNKKAIVATAITTILSATAAVVAIKKAKKSDAKEEKSEVETVLDGLVEDCTITEDQQIAILSAITAAKEAATVEEVLTTEEIAATAVEDSNETGTLTKITTLFKGHQDKNS